MNESTPLQLKQQQITTTTAFGEVQTSNREHDIHRHLTLIDLVSIGLAGTVGSGFFVLIGFIANNYAGPASVISWALAGVATLLSGVSYAELASTLPGCGSSYLYVYKTMGASAGIVTGICLSLEYAISGSAIARAWGDKVQEYITMLIQYSGYEPSLSLVESLLNPDNIYGFSIPSFLVSTISVYLLLRGVEESKFVTNFFTALKMLVVVFMIIGGLLLFKMEYEIKPFLPKEYGFTGVLTGATSSFFGYLGWDEVCVLSGEAVNPQRDTPRAVLITIFIVTLLYIAATVALTGMQPYADISESSGFSQAFRSNGYEWAAHFTIIGELISLPIVVLVSIMAQPRLQYAMALDNLLPQWMADADDTGNLVKGTWFSGIITVLVAAFVPFKYLDDTISAGCLVAFCLTNK